jgi:8-oxo-dGTP pyrophosphatase MutT (NUDIX family)
MELIAQITTQAIILNDEKKILLLKRNKGGGLFTLPGGTIHKGEKVTEGLERELFEETGLKIKPKSPVWIWQSEHIGKDLLGIVFSTSEILKTNVKIIISPEHDQFAWFSLDEYFNDDSVDSYIKRKEIKDLLSEK